MVEYARSPSCQPPAPHDGDPCPCADSPAAPGLPVARNRYFTGKYMTARDFRDEQEYFLARQRLHLRALHGWGIVCGFEVEEHDPDCQARGWVVVKPGIAVDCHGREIVLTEPAPVYLPGLLEDDVPAGTPAGVGFDGKTWDDRGPPDDGEFLLGVRYAEVCVEPVPVLIDESGCRSRTTPNRVREQPEFRFLNFDPKRDAHAGCWLPRGWACATYPPAPGPDFPAGCGAPPSDPGSPRCPCGSHGFVPLARLRIRRTHEPRPDPRVVRLPLDAREAKEPPKGDPWPKDLTGRRYLFGPLHPYTLTHICKVNWAHGGATSLNDLDIPPASALAAVAGAAAAATPRWCRLTLEFDRPLCPSLPAAEEPGRLVGPAEARLPGFYQNVLRVEFEHQVYGSLPLAGPGHRRYRLSDDRKQLHYEFRTDHLNDQLWTCGVVIVRVTLNCDFLPDEYGRAVDGNHLRGSLGWRPDWGRTGDGVEGGVFESWFQLTGLEKKS